MAQTINPQAGGNFHSTAINNATTVGLNKQIKKSDGEISTEKKDQVTLGENRELDKTLKCNCGHDTPETGETTEPTTPQAPPEPPPPDPNDLLPQTPVTGNPYIDNLINSGQIPKEKLQQILDLDAQRREKEQMMIQYDMKEKEAMRDAWLNIWGEAQKAEHERMKTFMAIMDALRATDASIAANKLKVNNSIQAEWYKAMFG